MSDARARPALLATFLAARISLRTLAPWPCQLLVSTSTAVHRKSNRVHRSFRRVGRAFGLVHRIPISIDRKSNLHPHRSFIIRLIIGDHGEAAMKFLCALFAMLLLQQVPSEEFTKEGRITLEKHDWRDQKQPTVITVGKQVTFAINAYIDDFMGKPIINANAKITNTTAANMHVIYF